VARTTVYSARDGSKRIALKPQIRGPKAEFSNEELQAKIR